MSLSNQNEYAMDVQNHVGPADAAKEATTIKQDVPGQEKQPEEHDINN